MQGWLRVRRYLDWPDHKGSLCCQERACRHSATCTTPHPSLTRSQHDPEWPPLLTMRLGGHARHEKAGSLVVKFPFHQGENMRMVGCLAASCVSAPSELGSPAAGLAVVASRRAPQCLVGAGLASAPGGAALCAVWRCPAHGPGACAPATAGARAQRRAGEGRGLADGRGGRPRWRRQA